MQKLLIYERMCFAKNVVYFTKNIWRLLMKERKERVKKIEANYI